MQKRNLAIVFVVVFVHLAAMFIAKYAVPAEGAGILAAAIVSVILALLCLLLPVSFVGEEVRVPVFLANSIFLGFVTLDSHAGSLVRGTVDRYLGSWFPPEPFIHVLFLCASWLAFLHAVYYFTRMIKSNEGGGALTIGWMYLAEMVVLSMPLVFSVFLSAEWLAFPFSAVCVIGFLAVLIMPDGDYGQ